MSGRLVVLVAALALAAGACSSGSEGDSTATDAPAACAGPRREGLEEVRTAQWDAASAALAADPASEVWLGFSRILTVDDVAELPGSLTVHGLQLVYEQNQGTYLKAQQEIDPVAADDPALADAAAQLLAASAVGGPPLPLPGIAPDALDPADRDIEDGEAPISALLVTGDVAEVLDDDPCLVYAMTPGGAEPPAAISPAIEPDPVHLDPG